jgi:hypothetical protein
MKSDGEWRKYLSKEERARIKAIDRALAKSAKQNEKLRKERVAIQNRATQRRRFASIRGLRDMGEWWIVGLHRVIEQPGDASCVGAGAPFWLFGKPKDWREELEQLEPEARRESNRAKNV